jgi:phytoene dehydrogenase-like protein
MQHAPRTVVVVGAGLAGLTAAATASDHGADVTLLEAREHPGGRARTARVDGFLFNQGAHALYRGGPAWSTLTSYGIEPRGRSPRTVGAAALRADGSLGAIPSNASTLLRTDLFGWRAKFELARLMARPTRLPDTVVPGKSMQQWIDGRSSEPMMRAFVALFSRVATYCGDLDALDAAAGVAQVVQAMTHGVVYLDDGWQQLVDAMQRVVDGRGVRVHTRAKVDAIERHDGGLVVRTASGDFDADAVVDAAGGPDDVDAHLHGASAAARESAQHARPVVASSLDLALRALPVPERRITFGLHEPIYLSVHTPYARLVPDGPGEVAHLLWYGETTEDPRPRLEALLDRAQPGWREQVVDARFGRRQVVAHDRPRPGAGFAGRAPVAVPDVPGLFVAGDWEGPEGLLADAVFASARAAGQDAATNAVANGLRTSA